MVQVGDRVLTACGTGLVTNPDFLGLVLVELDGHRNDWQTVRLLEPTTIKIIARAGS